MSAMKAINVEKLVINMGTGSDENIQHNAKRLLEIVTGRKPADAYSKKRNPAFKISKGQKIGAFVTIRGKEIRPIATKMLDAIDSRLKESSVSNNSLSFGIREYIDIAGVKYDPKIGRCLMR
ncbi:MAG: 50S ribosomal protein L5 [Candidatus Marsarchaeota archaeon]|nr:50S ribosomal protein L5 [Candidatus Marsarchaeota archaeon]